MAIEVGPDIQQPIGVRFGRPERCSVSVVVCSLSGSDVTVILGGQVETVSMTAIGADAPVGHPHNGGQAGYVGSVMIGGLLPATKYTYKVYQDNYKVTVDEKGKPFYTWTAPNDDDDFIWIPITCDNNVSLTGSDPQVALVGGWSKIREIAEANPDTPLYVGHIDDVLGYTDNAAVDEGIYGDGHVTASGGAPSLTAWEYDYAIASLAAYGLYHHSGSLHCTWGQKEDRIWGYRNCPVIPQHGDHDSGVNEMGWDKSPTDVTDIDPPNLLTRAKQFTNSNTVWQALMGPLQGASIRDSNTTANHWSHRLGCLQIIAPDGITDSTGNATSGDTRSAPTSVYGSNQCLDILQACDISRPFKTMLLQLGIRHLTNFPLSVWNSGGQNPISSNPGRNGLPRDAHVDFMQMFTDAGGLMSLANTDGSNGVFWTTHGDLHSFKAQYNNCTPALDSNFVNAENFVSLNLGTVNGCINFTCADYDGITLDGTTVLKADGTYGEHRWWVTPHFVYGSRATKEVELYTYTDTGALVWSGKFVENNGNAIQDI